MNSLKPFLIGGLMLLSFSVLGQSQCQDDIDQANKLFDEGSFREAEKITKQTLESCELNKTQENEMLKLMASIYYEMDEIELGDEYVAQFMKKNPYYISSKRTDPTQFREAINKVKPFARFSVGIRGGVPIGLVTTKKVFPVLDTANYLQDYHTKPVIQAGLEFCWNMNSFISLNIGAGLRIQKILHQVPQYQTLYFNYEEKNMTTNFPFTLGFSIPCFKNFSTKIFLGAEMELFLNSGYSYYYTTESSVSREFSQYLNNKKNNIKIEKDERNNSRYALLGGLKLVYKIKSFDIFIDTRYIRELDYYNNIDLKFKDQDLYFNNNYVLSDIMLENIDISVGLSFNFSYKVKSKY